MTTRDSDAIADKVHFWEEQDKINQQLIPRVIRQNELLAKHIAEHDNLPEVAASAISRALAEAGEEQRRQYEAALGVAKRELAGQSEARLEKAMEELLAALSDTKAELSERTESFLGEATRQLEVAAEEKKSEMTAQAQASLDQGLAALREESRKVRNVLVFITSGAGAICIATLLVGLLT